ncbi:MAG: DUF4149 domain-containing protein [Anaerolineales bacterium]|nr:DUF4149 domain-containing protein [Anaerolineales bacterium]
MPELALTVAYWLHMVATVIWIGGLFFQATIIPKVVMRTISIEEQPQLLESIRKRFDPVAWLCLAVLVVTGLTQMAANPNYDGFLSVENRWSAAILYKHLAILLMVALAAYQTWVLQPQIIRLAILRQKAEVDPVETAPLLRRQFLIFRLNGVISLLVLALTAIARTA